MLLLVIVLNKLSVVKFVIFAGCLLIKWRGASPVLPRIRPQDVCFKAHEETDVLRLVNQFFVIVPQLSLVQTPKDSPIEDTQLSASVSAYHSLQPPEDTQPNEWVLAIHESHRVELGHGVTVLGIRASLHEVLPLEAHQHLLLLAQQDLRK